MPAKKHERFGTHSFEAFTGDGRGNLYVSAFYEPGVYNQAINEANASDIAKYPAAWSAMVAKDYTTKGDLHDNDVHYEFTDFITSVASFHKMIDPASGTSTVLDEMLPKLNDFVDALANPVDATFTGAKTGNMFSDMDMSSAKIFDDGAGGKAGFKIADITSTAALTNNLSQLQTFVIAILSYLADDDTSDSVTFNLRLYGKTFDNLWNDMNDSTKIPNYRTSAKTFGKLTKDISVKDFISSYVTGASTGAKALSNGMLDVILTQIIGGEITKLNTIKSGSTSELKSELKTSLIVFLTGFAKDIVTVAYGQKSTMTANRAGIKALFDNFIKNTSYFNNITSQLKQQLWIAVKKALSSQFTSVYTTLSNTSALHLYEQVYKVWSTLTDETKAFYNTNMSLMKKDTSITGWSEYHVSDSVNISPSDYDNYRINLKKTGGGKPIFGLSLPKLWKSGIRRIYYTKNDNSQWYVDASSVSDDFFRSLYDKIYSGGVPSPTDILVKYDPSKRYFNINVDKFIRQMLFEMKHAPIPEPETKPSSIISFTYEGKWERDTNGLYIMDGTTKHYISDKDSDYNRNLLRASNKCYTTGVDLDSNSCNKAMYECLIDNDPAGVSKCINALNLTADKVSTMRSEVGKMHPLVAQRLLQRFGFRKVSVYDSTAKMTLDKIESIDHWKEHVAGIAQHGGGLDQTAKSALATNGPILDYLSMIVSYVNANPAILNKNYSGKSDEAVGVEAPSSYAQKLNLPQYVRIPTTYSMRSLNVYSKTSPFGIIGIRSTPEMSPMLSITSQGQPSGLMIGMHGGGMAQTPTLDRQIAESADLIEWRFKNLLNGLKQYNKSLTKEQEDKLMSMLTNIHKTGNELAAYGHYLSVLIKYFSHYRDYSSKILTWDNIKKIQEEFDKSTVKYGTGQKTLLRIAQALESLISSKDKKDNADAGDYRPLDVIQ